MSAIELGVHRYEIDAPAGAGGMGTVYRARSRETGESVAIKVLHGLHGRDVELFRREAIVLSKLHHPGVVRYLEHGLCGDGAPYLAMEWLDGEDLGQRLRRSPLTVAESLTVFSRLAEVLAWLHAAGVVHRDIKPSNLFLVDGRLDTVKVIDFGIARLPYAGRTATRTGTRLGTPGYMAPEQASGDSLVDARADVFSMGCVLFECLTGRPAFAGEHAMAVLAKVLFDEVPEVRKLRPEVPFALSELVARMLCKQPGERPASAAEVLLALDNAAQVGDASTGALGSSVPRSGGLSGGERQLVSLLLTGPDEEGAAVSLLDRAAPPALGPRSDVVTMMSPGATTLDPSLWATLAKHGARLARLVDGTTAVALSGSGVATDQAARAVDCALALQRAVRGRPVALATGLSAGDTPWMFGEVIDRAARLLVAGGSSTAPLTPPGSALDPESESSSQPILVDDLTRSLLRRRSTTEDRISIPDEHELVRELPMLLGKPTACVGRDRELRALEALFQGCVAEASASPVVITAATGAGKSRIRHEMIRRLRALHPAVEIWTASGEPMGAEVRLGMLGQFVRRTAGIRDGEPQEVRWRKLAARVAVHVDAAICAQTAEFLGELSGVRSTGEPGVQLRAARQDPILMGDQMRRAWVTLIRAECDAHPVVLVLEDLHWADRTTIEYLDATLRLLQGSALMIVALARPEISERFPRLWGERGVTEIRLRPLSRVACAALIHEVLGEGASEDLVERLTQASTGNAFFLEELLRAAREGRETEVPATVLAMVQSRLAGLEIEWRRVVRAASILGRIFWRGALEALLGDGPRGVRLDECMARLEEHEWISWRSLSAIDAEPEYEFNHEIMREAAYETLTSEDRVLGHRLAGEWLARVGGIDPVVLAGHFERGGYPTQAVVHYSAAAKLSLDGNDWRGAVERVERAILCGAGGETLDELALIRAQALGWLGDWAEGERWALEVMNAAPAESARWYTALVNVAMAASRLGHNDRLNAMSHLLDSVPAGPEVSAAQAIALAKMVLWLFLAGLFDRAETLFARLSPLIERFDGDPLVSGHVFAARSIREIQQGNPAAAIGSIERTIRSFEQIGDLQTACGHRVIAGVAFTSGGRYREALAVLRDSIADARKMGLRNIAVNASIVLANALSCLDESVEARVMLVDAARECGAWGDTRGEGAARLNLARLLQRTGDHAEAEVEAGAAVTMLAFAPALQGQALATLADVLLARGAVAEACERALQAVERATLYDALVCLVHAETLAARGDHRAAREVLFASRDQLLTRAAAMPDPSWRKSFLEDVEEHARTFALVRALDG
jgi:tetratricopeptide (TPR) repeat protein